MSVLLMSALLFTGVPHGAQEPGQGPAASGQAAAEDPITCRRLKVTGSHVKRERVCRRMSEWDKIANQQRDHWRQQSLDQSGKPPGG